MILSYFDRKDEFGYFWLKSVEAFDLSVHCAKCILGRYDHRIWSNILHAEDLYLPNKMYYLCGVTKPYVWKNNFHLAFEESIGDTIDIVRKGVTVRIEDAKEIEFSQSDVNTSLKNADKYQYYSCRNWQFANKMCFSDDRDFKYKV